MSFVHLREKLMIDRFVKAEEVRKFRHESHRYVNKTQSRLRNDLVKASQKVRKLEKSLEAIHLIREKRRILKDLYHATEKQHNTYILKMKVHKDTLKQSLKLRAGDSPKFSNLPLIKSSLTPKPSLQVSPSHHLSHSPNAQKLELLKFLRPTH